MELLEGETLAARLKKGKLSIADTLRYGSQIADALAEAHAKGITHRDLKPGNIMMAKSGVKVLDFGLAKLQTHPGETLTGTNVVMGTPAYMAPEQLEGKEAGPWSDIYSLGLVLQEMATGKLRGFTQETPLARGVRAHRAQVGSSFAFISAIGDCRAEMLPSVVPKEFISILVLMRTRYFSDTPLLNLEAGFGAGMAG
ncbi:MAG: serine/threonine protein kinase [Acidobacteriia bacterium]|nr:serine/threonine protein kinase [Terriglobia bacterium]